MHRILILKSFNRFSFIILKFQRGSKIPFASFWHTCKKNIFQIKGNTILVYMLVHITLNQKESLYQVSFYYLLQINDQNKVKNFQKSLIIRKHFSSFEKLILTTTKKMCVIFRASKFCDIFSFFEKNKVHFGSDWKI